MARGDGLTPFKPGQSGNPKGRPPGSISIMSAVKRILRENPEKLEELARSLIENSIQGNPTALKQTLDRLEGPVPTVIDNLSTLSDDELRAIAEGRAGGVGAEGVTTEPED